MEKEEMTRAERAAYMACPPDIVKTMHGEIDFNASARAFFMRGYEQALKEVADLIDARLSQILGDAQPAPILRIELTELRHKIGGGSSPAGGGRQKSLTD